MVARIAALWRFQEVNLKRWVFQFQVTILETGTRLGVSPGVGVVQKNYDTTDMPGWGKDSLGYHTDDGKIYYNDTPGRETKGFFF